MKLFCKFIAVCVLVGIAAASPPPNEITIKNASPSPMPQYTLQIARPFLEGEIPTSPQLVDKATGTPVPTQSTVKRRHPDGSVQHAIIVAVVPLNAGQSKTYRFQNQPDAAGAGAMTKSEMLSFGLGLDATFELRNGGTTKTVVASDILQADHYEVWFGGPIATSVIIAAHDDARSFDVGFDTHRSFRPVFMLTMWPSVDRVDLRFVGENCDTRVLQQQSYDLTLKVNGQDVYSQDGISHLMASRWTRRFVVERSGTTITTTRPYHKVDVDNNVDYLRYTRNVIPFFYIPSSGIGGVSPSGKTEAELLDAKYNINGAGGWQKSMGTTGGRDDIGIMPGWESRWICTGRHEIYNYALAQSDLAQGWRMCYREGDPNKWFDNEKTIKGQGRIVSIKDRPSIRLSVLSYKYTKEEDKVTTVGSTQDDGWKHDTAHQASFGVVLYALTGDFYQLEIAMFAAAYNIGEKNWDYRGPKPPNVGPRGATSGMNGMQIRGEAWSLRSRIDAAMLIPDNMPEKQYVYDSVLDAIEIYNGGYQLTGPGIVTTGVEGRNYQWGKAEFIKAIPGGVLSPLNLAHRGGTHDANSGGFVDNYVKYAYSPWMDYMRLIIIGLMYQRGFPNANYTLEYVCRAPADMLLHPDFNKYFAVAYRMPSVRESDGDWFQTWSEMLAAWSTSSTYYNGWHDLSQATHSYTLMLTGGMSACAELSAHYANAWDVVKVNLDAPAPIILPKWSLIPPLDAGPTPPSPPTAFPTSNPTTQLPTKMPTSPTAPTPTTPTTTPPPTPPTLTTTPSPAQPTPPQPSPATSPSLAKTDEEIDDNSSNIFIILVILGVLCFLILVVLVVLAVYVVSTRNSNSRVSGMMLGETTTPGHHTPKLHRSRSGTANSRSSRRVSKRASRSIGGDTMYMQRRVQPY